MTTQQLYLVVLLHGLLPHLIGLVPSILDRLGLISSPQGMGGKLACGQVSRAPLLHLRHPRKSKLSLSSKPS